MTILPIRIAENGNVIINGINYHGEASQAQASIDNNGNLQATCMSQGGIPYFLHKNTWRKAFTRRGKV